MNKQVLQMKYHPAKKEVEFRRFQNGQEIPIRNDSRLMHYMKQKGKFILQDHGNDFFDDITNAFDGLKSIDIQVITTGMDYDDFKQMIEFYNEEPGKCKINTELIAELPNMEQTFNEVKKYGEDAVAILQRHSQKLFEIPLENENVKKSAESFVKQIDVEIKNITEKINSLNDNNVNLCFAGVYSSGKSSLINAILGYSILPEAIKSETAKMFKIASPKQGENVKIKFKICSIISELEWNYENQSFEFIKAPSENEVTTEIQRLLNKIKDENKKQHEQIKSILSKLNEKEEISSEITVMFPLPLDKENVQFTIYDTPGTDSNYLAHQQVLNEALQEQRQSILIFVIKPDGLEGEGNNSLLNYIKAVDEKDSKTSIDIARSLFVINKADTVSSKDRLKLQHQEIKNKDDDNFSIKLADKKLFFTSAYYGYIAKAMINNIATDEEEFEFEDREKGFTHEKSPKGFCYRQDRCATSEYATKKMIDRCENVLNEAKEKNDRERIFYICTGLYALESEIVQYGEKYASAVRAFAIIDSVNKALAKLSNHANSLKESNQEEITAIEASIVELQNTINRAIDEERSKVIIPKNEKLPEKIVSELGLDSETLNDNIIGITKSYIDDQLKPWFLGLFGQVKVNSEDKVKIENFINEVFDKFTNTFLSKRKDLLEKQRDDFMEAVKDTIIKNGKISESAKKYFQDIPKPTIIKPDNIEDIGSIYDSHSRTDRGIIFDSEYLDKKGFRDDIEERLMQIAGKMSDDYGDDYLKSLEVLIYQIRHQFESNLGEYSLNMKAMIEDREAMKQLGGRILNAANDLESCKSELDNIIWKEIKNA